MCPACLTTAAWVAAGSLSAGGLPVILKNLPIRKVIPWKAPASSPKPNG